MMFKISNMNQKEAVIFRKWELRKFKLKEKGVDPA
jgi:hypothetical protein